MSLDNCRVILVRTHIAANLGATARVMRNFGLSRLVLVDPRADPLAVDSRKLSTHGEPILHAARTVATLDDAVADCALIAATSARIGGLLRKQAVGPPEEVAPRLVEVLATQPAALVFGPEPSGLTNDEVARCHYLIHIPAADDYPALNLAQAVAICLYTLRSDWLKRSRPIDPAPVASVASQERMLAQLQTALEEVHFLYGAKAESLMFALRHLIARAGPTDMEVGVLFGLARQLRWFVAHQGPSPHATAEE